MLIIDTDTFPILGKHHDESDERHTVGNLSHLQCLLEDSLEEAENEVEMKKINREINGIVEMIKENGDIIAKLDINDLSDEDEDWD